MRSRMAASAVWDSCGCVLHKLPRCPTWNCATKPHRKTCNLPRHLSSKARAVFFKNPCGGFELSAHLRNLADTSCDVMSP